MALNRGSMIVYAANRISDIRQKEMDLWSNLKQSIHLAIVCYRIKSIRLHDKEPYNAANALYSQLHAKKRCDDGDLSTQPMHHPNCEIGAAVTIQFVCLFVRLQRGRIHSNLRLVRHCEHLTLVEAT